MTEIKLLPKTKRKYSNKQNEDYNNRQDIYKTKEWKELRLSQLMKQPLCECCLLDGRVTPAIDVHHIISFTDYTGNARLYWAYNADNLSSLCKFCHNKIHHNKEFRDKYTVLLLQVD